MEEVLRHGEFQRYWLLLTLAWIPCCPAVPTSKPPTWETTASHVEESAPAASEDCLFCKGSGSLGFRV